MKKFITKSAEETEKLGEKLAAKLKGGRILALTGELGGGKTTFIKGLARELGVKEQITSPSFLILKKYKTNKPQIKFLYHFDAYRLSEEEEILDLGFEEITREKKSVVVIEWANKVKKVLPSRTIKINFYYLGKNKREILIKNTSRS